MSCDRVESYLPVIRRHFPSIDVSAITSYCDGHDHYVFVVDHRTAFRFPRPGQHGKNDAIENIFLNAFANQSTIPVHIFEPYSDKDTGLRYQIYEFIPGIGLSQYIARVLPSHELERVAIEIGRFLKVLHTFSLDSALGMNMLELDPTIYWKWFQEFIERYGYAISQYFSDNEQEWVKERYSAYIILMTQWTFTVKVTHSDLLPEHIIIDPMQSALYGIIDFSPRIADPANDFKCLDRYGNGFLQTVYEQYGPVDEMFDERRRFYAADLLVNNLWQAITGGSKALIEKQRRELSEYISAHS